MYLPSRLWSKDSLCVLLFVLLCAGLGLMPSAFGDKRPQRALRHRAAVIAADNADLRQNLIIRTGSQRLRVELLAGPHQGQQIDAINQLSGKMELDEVYSVGDTILLEYALNDQGTINAAHPRGRYRLTLQLVLIAMFAALLLAVAGWTGVKALLSFVFAALMIWKVMLPLFLQGYDPVYVGLGVVAALTASVSFLVGGLTRKGLATFLGAFLGLLLTCLLAQIFMRGFHIHGAVQPFAETLLYSGFYDLNLNRIFIAGVFTASSGAVMDLAMDISASMDEIIRKKPQISFREHVASGLTVGRAVIGTMTTTLLLAYSGGYTAMLMLFIGQGVPLENIFNLNFVAAELLNTVVGSFGLVTVAPFTALVAGLMFRTVKRPERGSGRPQPG
jgi:uncharacterized membrane protein